MLLKIFTGLIVLVAVIVGALALSLPRDAIVHLIVFRDFFDVSLPILAFGALIKYLCSCRKGCGCGSKGGSCNCSGNCGCGCSCCKKG